MTHATHSKRPARILKRALGAILLTGAGVLLVGATWGIVVPPPPPGPFAQYPYTVLAYNDLGMHCMQQDFSELMILPPFNTLRAQVIDRTHGSPEIVTSGVTVKYSLPGNTHGADKTNFWRYAEQLLGAPLAPDVGLTGSRMSGSMVRMNPRDWGVTGIPLVPIDDSGRENPYPIATITVERNGQVVGKTQAVVPVSWEMSCQLCHNTPGISMATDILRAHDRLHGTTLEQQKPVFCASCHMDNALGTPGVPGVPSLTSAMHRAHGPRMGMIQIDNECYACHPGIRTQCQRDVHAAAGISCITCHGDMAAVGNPARNGWVDQPRCGDCHTRPGFEFEPPGTLFRDAVGHQGVKCIACHSSPHTITPATTERDNLQSMSVQGHPGVISSCTVCHTTVPSDPFPHRRSE